MFHRGKALGVRQVDRREVIAAGGASGYRPAMSQSSLELAVAQGADAVSVSVASSNDGVLFVLSSLNLSESTDVGKQLWAASRYGTHTINGMTSSGWFAHEFSAEQLGQLHYTEPLGRQRAKSFEHSGVEPLMPLSAALEVIAHESTSVEVYIDVLEPDFHERLGLPVALALEQAIADSGWRSNDSRLIVVSPEKKLLRELRDLGVGARHLYRCDAFGTAADEMAKPDGERRSYVSELRQETIGSLRDVCDGVVVPLAMIDAVLAVTGTTNIATQLDQSLIRRAHDAGLLVFGQTLRAENRYRPDHLKKGVDPSGISGWESYFERVLAYDFDGVMCDQPDLLIAAKELIVE